MQLRALVWFYLIQTISFIWLEFASLKKFLYNSVYCSFPHALIR